MSAAARTRLWPALALCTLLGACCLTRPGARGGGGEVPLDPPDRRPILAIQVADPAEAGLLEQELKIQVLRQEGTTLYLFSAEGLEARLKGLGYEPTRPNPHEVFRRVVRVGRRGAEEDLRGLGLRLINREKDYWVVEGSLASLRAVERGGYRLSALGRDEPRPREVRILAITRDQVQMINELHVDIFSVVPEGRGFVVAGAAFDDQIDAVRALGLAVQVVP